MKTSPLLDAVQLIDRHQNFIYANREKFCQYFNISDLFMFKTIIFQGAYLTFDYIDTRDTNKKMQVPLFDYLSFHIAAT